MSDYDSLAFSYDSLTHDVPYESFADYYESIFKLYGVSPKLMLDMACGTGTLTNMLAERGYEMIGVNASPEMLGVALEKAEQLPDGTVRPLFLCQKMEELDLYGTVEAVICSLDGLNYVPTEILPEVFRRVGLFLEPGGIFIFDVNTPQKLISLDGEMFIDETDDTYCVWRAEWDDDERACLYGIDIFTLCDDLWERNFEEHIEYSHEASELTEMLEHAGFENIQIFGELSSERPGENEQRIFFTAKRR